MTKPTKAERIEELLGLSEHDYAVAMHDGGVSTEADVIASFCISNGNDHQLEELRNQALESLDLGRFAVAGLIEPENDRDIAAKSGEQEWAGESFAEHKQALEKMAETLQARERELEQMSEKDVAIIHERGMAVRQRRLEEDRLLEEERRRVAEGQQQLEDEQHSSEEELGSDQDARERIDQRQASLDTLEYYARMPCWTKEEAVALSLGLDPEVVNWESIREYQEESEIVGDYQRRLELLDRAQKVGRLDEHIAPGKFLVWARHYKIALPDGLTEAVSQYDEETIDWRSKYEELKRTSADRDTSAPRHPRQERSDAIIILGIARNKFHFKPDKRSSAAKRIADCCFREGLKISEDTVRDRLMNANRVATERNEGANSLS